MTIGEKIKQLRESSNMSSRELASRSGIAPSHMSYIEKDQVNISVEKLSDICLAFKIDLITFLSEIDVKPMYTKQQLEFLESIQDLSEEQLQLLNQLIKQFKN